MIRLILLLVAAAAVVLITELRYRYEMSRPLKAVAQMTGMAATSARERSRIFVRVVAVSISDNVCGARCRATTSVTGVAFGGCGSDA